jgi:hypothetical protein
MNFLNSITDDDKVPRMPKKNPTRREFSSMKLGQERTKITEIICPEASYDKKTAKNLAKREIESEESTFKNNLRIYGYKHPKTVKFVCLLMKCLQDCVELKPDQLNMDMNNFLLLKNELSLAFLRNQDNIVTTLKSAIKIFSNMEENTRKDLE